MTSKLGAPWPAVWAKLKDCPGCKAIPHRGGWTMADLEIYHDNDHAWPGYAGEPSDDNFGGSDF